MQLAYRDACINGVRRSRVLRKSIMYAKSQSTNHQMLCLYKS